MVQLLCNSADAMARSRIVCRSRKGGITRCASSAREQKSSVAHGNFPWHSRRAEPGVLRHRGRQQGEAGNLSRAVRRLQTDYVDLYWFHQWDRFTPIEETMRTLDDLVTSGKVRCIGLSDTPAGPTRREPCRPQYHAFGRSNCVARRGYPANAKLPGRPSKQMV
jgi:Aldo/keto reductase family